MSVLHSTLLAAVLALPTSFSSGRHSFMLTRVAALVMNHGAAVTISQV